MTDPFNPRHAASLGQLLLEVLGFSLCLSVLVTLAFLIAP